MKRVLFLHRATLCRRASARRSSGRSVFGCAEVFVSRQKCNRPVGVCRIGNRFQKRRANKKRRLYTKYTLTVNQNCITLRVPTEAPAKTDLRNKFRFCCGGSAIRASSIALAFCRSWGWVQFANAASPRETRPTVMQILSLT